MSLTTGCEATYSGERLASGTTVDTLQNQSFSGVRGLWRLRASADSRQKSQSHPAPRRSIIATARRSRPAASVGIEWTARPRRNFHAGPRLRIAVQSSVTTRCRVCKLRAVGVEARRNPDSNGHGTHRLGGHHYLSATDYQHQLETTASRVPPRANSQPKLFSLVLPHLLDANILELFYLRAATPAAALARRHG